MPTPKTELLATSILDLRRTRSTRFGARFGARRIDTLLVMLSMLLLRIAVVIGYGAYFAFGRWPSIATTCDFAVGGSL